MKSPYIYVLTFLVIFEELDIDIDMFVTMYIFSCMVNGVSMYGKFSDGHYQLFI